MADIEVEAGNVIPLALKALDGNTGLYPRATIFNGGGSPVPVSAIDLDHKALGLYRADHAALAVGKYVAVYRFFTDAARTIKADYNEPMDYICVTEIADQEPMLGVAYNDAADRLNVDVYLLRRGQTVTGATSAQAEFFDDDDNLLFTLNDAAPDGEGIFRMEQGAPGLVKNRLYNVTLTIETPEGTVVGNKGFKVIG